MCVLKLKHLVNFRNETQRKKKSELFITFRCCCANNNNGGAFYRRDQTLAGTCWVDNHLSVWLEVMWFPVELKLKTEQRLSHYTSSLLGNGDVFVQFEVLFIWTTSTYTRWRWTFLVQHHGCTGQSGCTHNTSGQSGLHIQWVTGLNSFFSSSSSFWSKLAKDSHCIKIPTKSKIYKARKEGE